MCCVHVGEVRNVAVIWWDAKFNFWTIYVCLYLFLWDYTSCDLAENDLFPSIFIQVKLILSVDI